MASIKKQKEALRAALYAFVAGAHHITEEVERAQSITANGGSPDAVEARQIMLEADYERFMESRQSIDMLVEFLNEEDLYPFGSEWPAEVFGELITKVVPPRLSIGEGAESDLRFRFKKGFKKLLADLASGLETDRRASSTLDHWMVLLLNAAFHAGMMTAARNAENTKVYYGIIPELEGETEPWSRYSQIADALDRQLRRETRRRTGLVSDLDYNE